jgi:hypothetical protein
MLTITTSHDRYSAAFIHWAARWVARRIGFPPAAFRKLSIEIGYRKNVRGRGSWGGCYRNRTVRVGLPRGPITYPQSMAHNKREREAGWAASDELELFVVLLAHELEHARVAAVAMDVEEVRELNHEPRVRDVAWGVLEVFRPSRAKLVADWSRQHEGVTA